MAKLCWAHALTTGLICLNITNIKKQRTMCCNFCTRVCLFSPPNNSCNTQRVQHLGVTVWVWLRSYHWHRIELQRNVSLARKFLLGRVRCLTVPIPWCIYILYKAVFSCQFKLGLVSCNRCVKIFSKCVLMLRYKLGTWEFLQLQTWANMIHSYLDWLF